MFSWKQFRKLHNQDAPIERRRPFLGGFDKLPRDVARMFPKKGTASGDFGYFVYWGVIILSFFLCWVITDKLFPANPFIAIPLALVLWGMVGVFYKKLTAP
jgi:hypothetical protein